MNVFSFTVRRIMTMIPMLFLVSVVVFLLIQLPPGDYVDTLVSQLRAQGTEVSASQIQNLKKRYGLGQPKYIQYFKWISGFPRGDFGTSFLYHGRQVLDVVKKYIGFTLLVAFSSQAFIMLVGIPIGVYSATHQYSLGDNLVTVLGFIGLSIPNFLLALVLMFVAYFVLNIPTLGGLLSEQYVNAPWSFAKVLNLLAHLWIPVVVLGTAGTAGTIRVMRGNLLDVLNLHYVNTARAKGLRESTVIWKHAVRNAIHPIIMGLGMRLPRLLSGATIVSIVLSLPTLGPVLFQALVSQDMYLAGSILLFQCVLLLVGNLLADLALAYVDPRIRYG